MADKLLIPSSSSVTTVHVPSIKDEKSQTSSVREEAVVQAIVSPPNPSTPQPPLRSTFNDDQKAATEDIDEKSQTASEREDALHPTIPPSNRVNPSTPLSATFSDDQKASAVVHIHQHSPEPSPYEAIDNDMIETQNTITAYDDEMKRYTARQESIPSNDHDPPVSPSIFDKPKHTTQTSSLKRIFSKITGKHAQDASELPSYASFSKFAWKDLNVFVGSGKKKKQILFDMNGSISSGQLMAIMGGSGAGKSTLLNVLSGRTNLNQQLVSGTLSLNQKSFSVSDQSIIKALCSFVPQSDVLCSTQTVREALMFYANLKLSHETDERQEKRIHYLMRVLHLAKCANNMIGDMNESSGNKGISGGERRRVSIAAEIINDVDIIFLDEPTSGLDSYTAAATIKTLKEFCTVSNKIIIATIHQPSIETFHLFDKLLLLSRGRCCFNSTVENVEVFFKDSLRPKTNPADVILFEIQQNPDQYAQQWQASNLNIEKMVKEKCHPKYQPFTNADMRGAHNNLNSAPVTLQMGLLLTREGQALYRDKKVSIVRLAQVLFFAFALALIYYDTSDSYSQKSGAFFLLSVIPVLFGMVSLLVVFPKQKELFQREYNSNTYSIFIFALSFILIEIPREIIHMLIFTVITYYLVNLDGDFYDYWINLFLCSFSGGSFGMLFGVISATTAESAQMVPAAVIPLLMFSDGWIAVKNLPSVIRWMAAIDPLYFLFRAFMIIEFKGVTYERTLTGDYKYFCDKFGRSKTFWVNGQWNGTNQTMFGCSIPAITIDVPPIYDNITEIVPNPFNVTIDDIMDNIINTRSNDSNFTATISEEQEKLEEFCREDIPSYYFFEARDLDPSSLTRYWLYLLAISLAVRSISLIILYVKSNNQVSFTNIFCVMGKSFYGKCVQLCGGKSQKRNQSPSMASKFNIHPSVLSLDVQYDENEGVPESPMDPDLNNEHVDPLSRHE